MTTTPIRKCSTCGQELKTEVELRRDQCWVCRHLAISAAAEIPKEMAAAEA